MLQWSRREAFRMRIALIGAGGQLGTDLQPLLGDELVPLGHQDVEITDRESVDRALSNAQPQFVINVAAYNLVDHAEDQPDAAFAVNALGPRNISLFCTERDIPLLHVSTDYVFSGWIRRKTKRTIPYHENDTPDAVSAYGLSKLAGEGFVRNLRRHFIVRTCGLYGHAAMVGRDKGNFVETMLRLGAERDELRVVDDQTCTPTSTADLARAVAALIETDAYGLYHGTNAGSTTWYGFAREIFRLADLKVDLTPITSAEFGAKARRPDYSVLDTQKLTKTIGFEMPRWQDALATYLANRPE